MSSRYYQLQAEASYSQSSHSPRTHRPQAHTTSSRSSSSSDSSTSSSSSSYSTSSYSNDSYAQRYSVDSAFSQQHRPRVEVLRCSRCAKSVEAVVSTTRGSNGELRRVRSDDATANGMVRFGHNLYYCERCARMVGYA